MDVASVLTLVVLAFFLAAQPWSVLAAVLLVTSRRGVAKEVAFAAGWVAALSVVAAVAVVAYPELPKTRSVGTGLSAGEVVVGVLLGAWLFFRWRRARSGRAAKEPAWMSRIDGMSPLAAFVLGAFLPNYVVVVAAVNQMLSSGLSARRLWVVALVWVLLASTGVGAPLGVLVARRDGAPQTYQRWRAWIAAHSRDLLLGVGGLVSVVLVVKGLIGLLR